MKENIIIENFGGIKNMDISLNKINILIGPQATGKSICAKLLFFFKNFDTQLLNAVLNDTSKKELDNLLINKFIEYFPVHTYNEQNFKITYRINDYFIEIKSKDGIKIELSYSDKYTEIFNSFELSSKEITKQEKFGANFEANKVYSQLKFHKEYSEYLNKNIGKYAGFRQIFVPAGRSFFANLQKNIFSFLSNNKTIDPFISEFGSFYSIVKDIQKTQNKDNILPNIDLIIDKILSSKYYQEKGDDYLIHPDGRKINIAYTSSGQQEILPLILTLKTLAVTEFPSKGATIYIEEPEAHIFPNAQKLIVELISYVFNNSKSTYQFFITTHSPYILTSFNNLIQAGIIENENEKTKKELYQIIKKNLILKPNSLNAYSLEDGAYVNLINNETKLISANVLDTVSNDISIEFDKLLNLL